MGLFKTSFILVISLLLLIICLSLSVYYTHKEHNVCDKYETVTFSVINISSYNVSEHMIYDCSKCQNGNMFSSCFHNLNSNLNGSCYKNAENKCKNNEIWLDEYGFTHKEKYTVHVKSNYFEHCHTGWILMNYFTIKLDNNNSFNITCQNSIECHNYINQKYQIGNIVNIVKDTTNRQYYDNIDCNNQISNKTIFIWVAVFILLLFNIYIYVIYRDKMREYIGIYNANHKHYKRKDKTTLRTLDLTDLNIQEIKTDDEDDEDSNTHDMEFDDSEFNNTTINGISIGVTKDKYECDSDDTQYDNIDYTNEGPVLMMDITDYSEA
jgi:hypothetical protein